MKYLISLLKRILNFFSYKIASKRGPASYWSSYMVDHKEFNDVNESLEHFEWRNSLYPGYIDLMPVNEANNLNWNLSNGSIPNTKIFNLIEF